MGKKQVLFIMPSMFIGGAERSLLGLLDAFDYDRYDVSLFLYRHEGEFLSYIPKQVKILPPIPEYATFDVPIVSLLKSRLFRFGLARVKGKLQLRRKSKRTRQPFGIWASMQYTSRSLQPLLPKIPGTYDAAIAFLGVPDVLLNKVEAKIKAAWSHTDYSILGPDEDYDRELYARLDCIVSVSESCTKELLKLYPEFASTALTVGNLLSQDLLNRQAEVPVFDMPKNENETVLLSVGRFSDQKNFDNVPAICRRICQSGENVRWYLIGYGGEETLIRQKIREAAMEDRVVILGKKENPYPYMRACDIYVQPSRYEGKCVSVLEAQILHKPVVITDYLTAPKQLRNGYDGVIVPMDNEGCADGLLAVIRDDALRRRLIENTQKEDYTNLNEINKVYQIIEGNRKCLLKNG